MTEVSLSVVTELPESAALVPLRVGAWTCARLQLASENELMVRFESPGTPDWVEVRVQPRDAPGAVFRRLERCSVRYRGSLAAQTPERRADVGALVLGVGASIDGRLAACPGATIAEALGRSREPGRVVFGRDMLRAMLAPEIAEGAPLAGGFSLADVYPSSHLREAHAPELELVLEFRRAEDRRRLLILVAPRNDERPAFATTAHFNLTHLALGAADPPGADAVRSLLSFVLSLRDHDALEVVFPDVSADVAPALLPEAAPGDSARPDEVLNLALNSDCAQSCVFCSIRETSPADDGGERVLARACADLLSNRQRGVRALRVNGYDPLAFSRILEVLRYATELGYERADVFSPCTVLAERAFCEAVVAALPAERKFFVPLYAPDAATHDLVVGVSGAFARTMAAIDSLCELVGPAAVVITTVATRQNLDRLAALASLAAARKHVLYPHMPYPSFESRADRYFEATPKQTDVAAAMASAHRAGARLVVQGVAPCVTFRAMRAAGLPPRAWLDVPDRPPPLPGTEYRDARFRHRAGEAEHAAFHASVVPCPHVASCSLAPACAGEVLRAYVELYGLSELSPVGLRELVDAG